MSDKNIVERLKEAWEAIAVCHCGNGIKDGCCDNHAPTWNPCPDSELLYDARFCIEVLASAVREARDQLVAQRDGGRCLRRETVIRDLENALKQVQQPAPAGKGGNG